MSLVTVVDPFPLESLPDPVFDQVFSYLTYHQLALLRRVDRKFNSTLKRLLNQGFRTAERFHAKCLKEVKSKLPRRESERRNHKLSRHCDILTAIETRISLLSMTFLKYVDLSLCCFIPGKVIDEIITVLRAIKEDENPPRAYEILQELRDISSMAMEYFDDKIVPTLKVQLSPLRFGGTMSLSLSQYSQDYSRVSLSGFSQSLKYSVMSPPVTPSSSPPSSLPSLDCARSEPPKASRRLFSDIERISKTGKKFKVKTSRMMSQMKKEAESNKEKVENQNKKIMELDQKIDQQNELIQQQNVMIAEQMEKLSEMNRRMIEQGLLPGNEAKKDKKIASASKLQLQTRKTEKLIEKLIEKQTRKRSMESPCETDGKKIKLDN